jgi:hypothetical protein
LQTAALDTPEMPLLRHIDLLVLVSAAAVFVVASLPMLGLAVAGGAWLVTKVLGIYLERRADAALASGNRRSAMGMTAAAGLGRVWVITLAILLVGIADRPSGLAAAVLSAVLFSVYLATRVVERMFANEEVRP